MRCERAEAYECLELWFFPPRQLRNNDENLNLNAIAEKEFYFPYIQIIDQQKLLYAAKVKVLKVTTS